MQAQYNIGADDFVAFNLNYMKHDATAQKRVRLSQLTGAVVLLIAGGAFCYMNGKFSVPVMLGVAILAVLYAAYIPWSVKGSVKKSVTRVLRDSSKTAVGEKTLTIEAEKLHLTGSGEDSFYEYGNIVQVITDDKHYFIYTGTMEALILPFRAFASEADRTAFYTRLCEKVKEAGGSISQSS